MKTIPLGSTGLAVTKTAMGCLPLQRCEKDYAVRLLRAAYEGGIRYFDTANAYTDSEEKIGLALADVRGGIVLSTKSQARDRAGVLAHIENSLKMLHTDHIDLFQANRWILEACGIPPENIRGHALDTYQDPSFFSARREGVQCGRNINAIRMG